MTNKIKLFGTIYVEADPMTPSKPSTIQTPKGFSRVIPLEDLVKEMNRSTISSAFIRGILKKLVSELQEYGAEFVNSDGDNFISIVSEDRETLIVPLIKDREMSISVERLTYTGALRTIGSVSVDENSTYMAMSKQIKKFVSKSITSKI